MIKRDFERYGVKFHLNDHRRNEYDARYTLLFFNEYYGMWEECCHVSTKREAIEAVDYMQRWKINAFRE